MNVKEITTNDLRLMNKQEGIIFQGCAGEMDEWVNGVNEMFTEAGILLENTRLEDVSKFEHDGLTNLLFKFNENDKIDMGKLAMWRLGTHATFGGTWLSDYVPNRLGGFIQAKEEPTQKNAKPDCPLLGQDGNIFNLMGLASQTLRRNGMSDAAKEMQERITSSGSYNEALCIIGEHVNITSEEDMDEGMEMTM